MSLEDFQLTENDSLPSLEYTVSRSGSGSTTPNLTDFTVSLKVSSVASTSNKFTLSVTSSGGDDGQITTPESGVVQFDWSTDNWSSSGTFVGEVSFENAAGKVETAPNRQTFVVKSEF